MASLFLWQPTLSWCRVCAINENRLNLEKVLEIGIVK